MHRFMSHLDDLAGLDLVFKTARGPARAAATSGGTEPSVVTRLRAAFRTRQKGTEPVDRAAGVVNRTA